MKTTNYNGKFINIDYDAVIDDCNGTKIIIDTDARLDNYGNDLAFYAKAHDEEGNRYEVRWNYVEPEWHKGFTPDDDGYFTTDLSDFADWNNPAEVTEL